MIQDTITHHCSITALMRTFINLFRPLTLFRLLFNALFDTGLGYSPDESYFALWERPYEQFNVTDRLNIPCPHRN